MAWENLSKASVAKFMQKKKKPKNEGSAIQMPKSLLPNYDLTHVITVIKRLSRARSSAQLVKVRRLGPVIKNKDNTVLNN